MSAVPGRALVVSLVLLGSTAATRAGYPTPEPPIPQRAALADLIVVGKVEKMEEPVQAFPLLRVRGGAKVTFKIARVRIDRALLGQARSDVVRVGVGPGRAMPDLAEEQTGCFFLRKHPEGPFHVLSAGSDLIDSRREGFDKALTLIERCAGLLANTDEGLRSKDGEDRLLTAAMLIFRWRTVPSAYSGAPRTEPVGADLSRRVLAVLREGSFADKAARQPTGRLTMFFRLDLTEEDGWAPPRDLPGIAAAAEKWLAENEATYRLHRYVPEEPMPGTEDEGPTTMENQTGSGTAVQNLVTTLRRGSMIWVPAVLVCALAVIGYAIGRQVWADLHCRRAEEALAHSLRAKGTAPLAEARRHLSCCLRVWPNSPRVNFLMAQAARRAGDTDEAARYLRRAEQLGWVVEALDLEKALATVQQGDLERMEPVLASFVQRDHPDKLLILEALVQGCRRTYQLPRALSYLGTWLEAHPDSVRALVWRGETLLLAGRNQDALTDYRAAVELDPGEDEARLKLADLLLASHHHEDAVTHFTEILKRHPDQGEALLGLARCREEQGDLGEAVKLLDRLLSLQPEHASALAERGKIALDAGSPAEAEKWLRQAVAAAPYEREPLYHLYRCLSVNGQTKEAEEHLARTKRIDEDRKRLDELRLATMQAPHDASLRCEIGIILLRNGQDKEGARWLQSALREQPEHVAARQALEEHYRRSSEASTKERP